MLYTFLILLTLASALVAIQRIVADKKARDQAKADFEAFENKHPKKKDL